MTRIRSALALAVVTATVLVSGCGSDAKTPAPTHLQGIQTRPARQVGTLSLPDASAAGAEMPFRAQPGQVLLVYFGYANCPDICPGTMADLRIARRRLGSEAKKVTIAMVTVDPLRDSATSLQAFLAHFFTDAHALRTDDPARLQTVADGFGVQYEVQVKPTGGEDVGHTSVTFAVDDTGRVVDAWPFGMSNRTITSDLRILLARAAKTDNQ